MCVCVYVCMYVYIFTYIRARKIKGDWDVQESKRACKKCKGDGGIGRR